MPRHTDKKRQPAKADREPSISQELIRLSSSVDWMCHLIDNLDQKSEAPGPARGSSASSALDRLCHMVENLDSKVDSLAPAFVEARRAPASTRPESAAGRLLSEAEQHNRFARHYNGRAQDGDFVLMPLRDDTNRLVSSFPRTLARLAFIYEDGELFEMLKAFDLDPDYSDHRTFAEFVGVNFAYVLHAMNTYDFAATPSVSESRGLRDRLRASAKRYARPLAPGGAVQIDRLNARAREHNSCTVFTLEPLRDAWGLALSEFPKDLFELFNPVYQNDVRFLLREYGLSDEAERCERRWVEFVGVPWASREGWLQDDLAFERYTAV